MTAAAGLGVRAERERRQVQQEPILALRCCTQHCWGGYFTSQVLRENISKVVLRTDPRAPLSGGGVPLPYP